MSTSFGQSTLPAMPRTSLSPEPESDAVNGHGKNSEQEAGPSALSRSGNLSQSPSPAPGSPSVNPRKKHRHLTPAEIQARKLELLLADPSKPALIPQRRPEEKTLRAPREMMKSVSGSSAGAGSGDFHVYKHARRREYERIKLMEEAAERERRTKEFDERQAQLQMESSAKTSKNRAKRDKKKQARLAARSAKGEEKQHVLEENGEDHDDIRGSISTTADTAQDAGASKRKRINAEGTAQVVFHRPNSDSEDDVGDDGERDGA